MSPAWAQNSMVNHLTSSTRRRTETTIMLCTKSSSVMTNARVLCKAISSVRLPTGVLNHLKEPPAQRPAAVICRNSATAVAAQMESRHGTAVSKLGSNVGSYHVVIGDPIELERKKNAIKCAGLSSLQLIADFDMTLTKYKVDGKRGQSTHALLHQGNAEYDRKRQELFDHYYPLETCPAIPVLEKSKLMEEWWGKTHALLVEGGLTQQSIKDSVENATIGFREDTVALFELLEANDVPVLIFSAGLADIIEEVMRKKLHRTFTNIRVVSNRMNFDGEGNLLGFRGKLIHVLNKNEHSLEMAAPLHDDRGFEVASDKEKNGYSLVRDRRNVILLGDHLGDLGMSDGLNYENRITVGFLNENVESWLDTYKKAFDIVVLNDGSMTSVVELVKELTSRNC